MTSYQELKKHLTDAISRTYSNSFSSPLFIKLFKEFPEMKSREIIHSSQDLLSLLFSTLFEGRKPGLYRLKTLGHFSAVNSTLWSSSKP